jgi:hypothetical protein
MHLLFEGNRGEEARQVPGPAFEEWSIRALVRTDSGRTRRVHLLERMKCWIDDRHTGGGLRDLPTVVAKHPAKAIKA